MSLSLFLSQFVFVLDKVGEKCKTEGEGGQFDYIALDMGGKDSPKQLIGENDYIAFAEYYNEPIGRSFGNCEIPFVTS